MALRSGPVIEPRKVAIYVRWSTEDQGDGTTLEVQMSGCRHYVLSQGWEVNEDLIFIDDGYSGGSLERPAMKKLRAAVQRGEVQCVVVLKLDRLSRSVVDTVNLVLREWGDRCYIKSARENIDTTNQAGKMFFYILVSYAEWERSVIKERTWSGKLKRAEEGRNPGFKAPYGYKWGEDNRLVIVLEEADIVRRIFDETLNGRGTRVIAAKLNEDGIRFRGGREWTAVTLRKMLNHRLYMGDFQYGATKINPNYGQREGEKWFLEVDEPLVDLVGGAPAIVSREVWEAVQVSKKGRDMVKNRKSGRAYSSDHLLTGILRCKCGGSMVGRYPGGKFTTAYYHCLMRVQKGNTHCGCGYIRQDVMDQLVVDRVRQAYEDRLTQDAYLSRWSSELEDSARELEAALAKHAAELPDFEKQEAHVSKLLRQDLISVNEYRKVQSDIQAERHQTERKMGELQEALRDVHARRGERSAMKQLLEQLNRWDDLAVPDRKHILRSLVQSLVAYKPICGEVEAKLVLKVDDPALSRLVEISTGTSA